MLVPKLATTLRTYDREQFVADLTAGVIVGIVALPLAIAFAIASGVTPDRGLCTAIIAGFLISALGGSRVQIGGPTGAFVVIVYGIVQKFGIDGLIVATMMAGVMLVILGSVSRHADCRAGESRVTSVTFACEPGLISCVRAADGRRGQQSPHGASHTLRET